MSQIEFLFNQIKLSIQTQHFHFLPQLLSYSAIISTLPTPQSQRAFFESILQSEDNFPQFYLSDLICPHLLSFAHFHNATAIVEASTVSSNAQRSTTFTQSHLDHIIQSLSSSIAYSKITLTNLATFLKQELAQKIGQDKKVSSAEQVVPWRFIINPLISSAHQISRVSDLFTSYYKLNFHPITPSPSQFTSYNDIQLLHTSCLTGLSNELRTLIQTTNNDSRDLPGSFKSLALSLQTNSILTHFSFNSTQYGPSFSQLTSLDTNKTGQSFLAFYPMVDRLQYLYCLGRFHLVNHQFYHANKILTEALITCIGYPVSKLNTTLSSLSITPQNPTPAYHDFQRTFQQFNMSSKKSPNGTIENEAIMLLGDPQVHQRQYIHNLCCIVKLLCPLRLAFVSGSLDFIPSLSTKIQSNHNDAFQFALQNINTIPQNPPNTQLNSNIDEIDLLHLDGLFSPSMLNSLGLNVFAQLSKAVINGNIYTFNHIVQSNTPYFIRTGTFSLIQLASTSVWVRFFYNLITCVVATVTPSTPHVIRYPLAIQALQVQRRRFIAQNPDLPSGYVIEDYDAADIECRAANLIYESRIKGYFKPGVALVLAKTGAFVSSWTSKRAIALFGPQ